MTRSPSHWQLPPGVTRGLWDYAHSDAVAYDYDEYFAFNRMFEFDEPLVVNALRKRAKQSGQPSEQRPPQEDASVSVDPNGAPNGELVVDLGCGTGRALVTLCRAGYRGLAVDLSQAMLDIVQEKADLAELPIDCLRANMVELDCLAESSVDHAICLFSTLGMIRGRTARRQALYHVARILRPGGAFVVHVHNFWFNLYDPRGWQTVTASLLRGWFSRDHEPGDRFFHYRGVSNMFLHVFRREELTADLMSAGLKVDEIVPLASCRDRAVRLPWLLPTMRAHGWIAICSKPR